VTAVAVHVVGAAERTSSSGCAFSIEARVAEGGRQLTCLVSVRGFPAPKATIHSAGTMRFVLRRGTIVARVAVTQRFTADGAHARQVVTGTVTGGTAAYAGAHGTIRGGGTLVDTATALRDLRLFYRIALR
jgi:hypothetical protein